MFFREKGGVGQARKQRTLKVGNTQELGNPYLAGMMHPKLRHTITHFVVLLTLIQWASGCRQPEAPEYYGFQNPQIVRSGSRTTLSTTLKFYNPNPYNLKLLRAEMDISLNGKHAGHSLLDTTIFIPRKDTFFVPVSLDVNLNSLLSNALAVLFEKQATISLDGRVKIKKGAFTFNRPFHYDGKQDLNTLLQGTGF